MKEFVHLHVHTEHSIRDSTVKIPQLIETTKRLGMKSVAITDHGTVSGIMEFYIECKKAGVVPIVGMEGYIVKNSKVKDKDEKRFHFTVLAYNRIGWDNLIGLSSEMSEEENFYYRPRADFDMLQKYSDGLVFSTACANSVIYIYGKKKARIVVEKLIDIYSIENIFLELMPHDIKEQKEHNLTLLSLHKKFDVGIISTLDVHYLSPEDEILHDMLMKMQDREPYGIDSLYLCDPKTCYDLWRLSGYIRKNAIEDMMCNTIIIQDKVVDYEIPSDFNYPKFQRKC